MIKCVYDTGSKAMWLKATENEKRLARNIYKVCSKSTNKNEKFKILITEGKPEIIMNALEVLYFKYDDNDGSNYYSIDKIDKDTKKITINIPKFRVIVSRNTNARNEIKRIMQYIQPNKYKTIPEKVKAFHDYICEFTDYDYTYEKPTTLYDALFAHVVVCEGYSVFMKALCDYANIPCQAVSNNTHQWNRIKYNNKWYYVDATWDDTTKLGNKYRYFFLPEEEFIKIHPKHIRVDKNQYWELS